MPNRVRCPLAQHEVQANAQQLTRDGIGKHDLGSRAMNHDGCGKIGKIVLQLVGLGPERGQLDLITLLLKVPFSITEYDFGHGLQ